MGDERVVVFSDNGCRDDVENRVECGIVGDSVVGSLCRWVQAATAAVRS